MSIRILHHVGSYEQDAVCKEFLDEFCSPCIDRATAQAHISKLTAELFQHSHPIKVSHIAIVPVARAGMAMYQAANLHFDHPLSIFSIGRKNKASRSIDVTLSSLSALSVIKEYLILDTVCATGDTVLALARHLRVLSPDARISVATCYAAPEAASAIANSEWVDHIDVAILATGCEEGWIIPRINGDAGDKLFGLVG